MRKTVLRVIVEAGEPMTMTMIRDALPEDIRKRPASSLPATLHWLTRAGLIERKGTRRSYVYFGVDCSDPARRLELAMRGWKRRADFS